jgi:predicted metal-dependent phosphoesterase TrpH
MVVADLHVHTTTSDGTLTLETLPAAAAAAGVDVVAVTDHDRIHPGLDAPVVDREGLTVVHGIELRVEPPGGERVDLLGYGVSPTDALEATVEDIQQNRIERGRAVVENVEDHLGVDLEVTVERGFGRPNVARAVDAHPDVGLDYQGAFDELIGSDGPCYVRRAVPSFERGREVLAAACDVVGLAHPFRYDDVAAALELTAELDAVERYYPYGFEADSSRVDAVIDDHDLLATGGSDAHETELGLAGLDAERYRPFRDALGI